jgi:hypothetical protein
MQDKESELHLDKHRDPSYMGVIIFEKPGKLFSYTPGDDRRLSHAELEEIIEKLVM